MGKKTGIAWTDSTHNFWYGCKKVSAGCKFCYAERDMHRFGGDFNKVTRVKAFDKPLHWKEPLKIFVCSWSDFFIEDADGWRGEAWDIMKRTPWHTYQILTKRIENVADRLPDDWGDFGWDNVWLGVTVENSDYVGRAEALCKIPAAVRWVSWEPSLSYVDFKPYFNYIDWVVGGCESAGSSPGRTAQDDWFRWVRDDCVVGGIPFFLKQMEINGKLTKEPELDGVKWNQFPMVKKRG